MDQATVLNSSCPKLIFEGTERTSSTFAGSVPSPAQRTERELFSNWFGWLGFLGLNPPIKAHSEVHFYCRIIPKSLQRK